MQVFTQHPLKKALLLCGLLSLEGCVSNLKPADVLESHEAQMNNGAISVDELLAQARTQTPKHSPTPELYLYFEPNRQQLRPDEERQLLDFAQQNSQTIHLDCAPSQQADQFSAASVAIQRCRQISVFLSQKNFSNEIRLSPRLKADQVRVYR